MKGIFDTRPNTQYDDDVRLRYHFPSSYLSTAKKLVDDWIIYREPKRGKGRMSYIAVARVDRVEPDPSDGSHYYAYVSDYLEFDKLVPLQNEGQYYEQLLNSVAGVGAALRGRSIRAISDGEFGTIVCAGLAKAVTKENPLRREHGDSEDLRNLQDFVDSPPQDKEREIAQMLVNRPFRDRAFRQSVVSAYKETCAVTRLRIVNGGGRAEVQAAHIQPVEDGGPDIVQNGIALSATCHWLFDRHLISITDEYSLLVAHNRVPREFQDLFAKQRKRIHLPEEETKWPGPEFLARHRDKFQGG